MSRRRSPFVRSHEFDFKLFEVNEDMQFQYETALGCGIDVPVSMLFPYLLALNAARFTDFIEERGLPLHLTNECYLSLFGPQSCDERKIGDIVATHETYHLWRRDHGPAISMELQGSNSTNITPGAMELLYAVTIARGIKGINIFMMVGGENPAGYENVTGRGYDISAPIDVDGNERPHAGVLRKLARVIDAGGRALLEAEPLRDTWIGCLAPYERDALVGGEGPMARVAELLSTTFSGGDMGLSNAASLPSLMTLAGVSFGCVDLERATVEELLALPQLWVPGLPHLERGVQERLVAFVQGGGHLLILPEVPTADERGGECRVLWDACMEGVIVSPPDARASTEAMHMLTTPAGESLVAPGRCWRFELPSGTEALAHDVKTGSPVAFTRPSGDGRVAVLGFHLEYVPNEQTDQMDFVERLATDAGARSLAARASTRRVAAMQLSSDRGAFVCLVNPVELPVATRVRCTTPRGTPLELPVAIDGIAFAGVGARLLPVGLQLEGGAVIHHATWELVAARDDRLTFSTPGEEPGEVHIAGAHGWGVTGAEVLERRPHDDGTLLVLRPQGVTCTLAPEGGGGA